MIERRDVPFRSRIREVWAGDGCALNCWLLAPTVAHALVAARQGFDSVLVDLQHGIATLDQLRTAIAVIAGGDASPLVRVPAVERSWITHALDAGAHGILAPMINTGADAAALVRECRYPPLGERSFGPLLALAQTGLSAEEYLLAANSQIVVCAMIETREAISNLDEILATPGIDGLYVGSGDLSVDFGGKPVIDFTDGSVLAQHRRIVAVAREHDARVGLHAASTRDAEVCIQLGADLLTVAVDLDEFRRGTERALAAARAIVVAEHRPAGVAGGIDAPAATGGGNEQ